MKWSKLFGIALILAIAISIYAASINDTEVKNSFMTYQSLAQVALGMTAYQQYRDASVSGTTVTYKRYKSGTASLFILRNIIAVDGAYTNYYMEYANDTWANRFTATYTPINE